MKQDKININVSKSATSNNVQSQNHRNDKMQEAFKDENENSEKVN